MRAKRRQRGLERLMDAVSFRVSPSQRAFMEKVAEKYNVGLCEAGRIILDEAIARAGGNEG